MESVLDSYKRLFVENAGGLGYTKDTVYEKLDETALANGYIKAEEEHNELAKNQYYSALMLRYWYKIYKYKESCKSLRVEDTEFITWLSEALYATLYYKDWLNPNKPVSKDKKAVDKIINRCCFSVRGRKYQEANKDKRKLNYMTLSIEDSKEKYGNSSKLDPSACDSNNLFVDGIVDMYVRENKLLEAMIVDHIGYQDVFKENKTTKTHTVLEKNDEGELEEVSDKYYKYSYSFDAKKLKNKMLKIDDEYLRYFYETYIDESAIKTFDEFKELFHKNWFTPSAIYKKVNSTLEDLYNKISKSMI